MHAQLRVGRQKTGHRGHQLIHAKRLRHADAQVAGRLTGSNLRFRFLQAIENVVAGRKKMLAFIGQPLPARRTMQQLHAEPAFEAVDALTDKRLAAPQKTRRRGEAAGLHDRLEDAHLEQSFICRIHVQQWAAQFIWFGFDTVRARYLRLVEYHGSYWG
jgi:hypothetical protein